MKWFLSILTVALVLAVAGEAVAQFASGVNPQGNERRSMGNLRNNQHQNPQNAAQAQQYQRQTQTAGGGLTHQRYGYGNAPYYSRPPVQPYYVNPTPGYRSPYPQVDQGYGYHVVPFGGQPQYVPPANYIYNPQLGRWVPNYNVYPYNYNRYPQYPMRYR